MALLINEVKRQNDAMAAEINAAIDRVMRRGWYILGPEVKDFEAAFASYCGTRECVTVGNGTDALEIALRSLQLPAGSRVATVANAGMYATTAILHAGLQPLYVDVDPGNLTMSPDALGAVIRESGTKKAAAVVVTHLYGQMAAMEAITGIAEQSDLPVIEDCAQAHGAVLQEIRAGAWGTLGCFSFYPTKNLGALGDGGCVVTNDGELAGRCRLLRQYGWTEKYTCGLPGGRNSRLDELQAAVLNAKLPYLDRWNARRREIAERYSAAFAQLPLTVPIVENTEYVAHLYVVRSQQRKHLRSALAAVGIATDVHYPVPDHLQQPMQSLLETRVTLPVTDQSCEQVLTLPCFPELTEAEQDDVIAAVHQALNASTTARDLSMAPISRPQDRF